MDTSEMFVKILLARKSLACVTLAIEVWAVELLAWAAVLVMDFAFVSQEAAGIGKARKFLTAVGEAFIWAVVFIHMLATNQSVAFKNSGLTFRTSIRTFYQTP
jgi:hypothetical protein